jgi:chromosome segregation ATPase
MTSNLTNTMTIPEAVAIAGKNESTIYRYIRKGKLKSQKITINDKQVTIIDKEDFERLFNIDNKQPNKQVTSNSQADNKQVTSTMPEVPDIKKIVVEAIQEQQAAIMKPIEEQALYRLGILENEVKHLAAEKETLRQENDQLREEMKLLPDKSEIEKLQQLQKELEEKNQQLQDKLKILPDEPINVNKILMQNADNLKTMQEKLSLLPAEPEKINEILKLSSDKLTALEEKYVKQAEELEKAIAESEEMKQKLSRKWWQLWW